MQVRKSIQTKKQNVIKIREQRVQNSKKRERKRQKQQHEQRQKQKQKYHCQKQNVRYKYGINKNKNKISPLKVIKKQHSNKSPTICTQRTIKKKNYKNKSPIQLSDHHVNHKYTNSHRDFDKYLRSISTKINTQRTPIKKYRQQLIKNKSLKDKKNKKMPPNDKKNKNKKSCQKKSYQLFQQSKNLYSLQDQQIKQKQNRNSQTKKIPFINTNCPKRKQSYFDQQILYKLNYDKYQFLQLRKNHQKSLKIVQQFDKLANQNTTPTSTNIPKQRDIFIQQNITNPPISYRDLQYFRKEQQLKWKIIYLQLSNLKQNLPTPQKIQQIIEQSDKNISEFQLKCKQLCTGNINTHYIFESPTKIRNALQNKNRKSSLQNKQLLKSLSDHKLQQQLSSFKHIQGFNPTINTTSKDKIIQQSPNNYCQQLQNQLEQYPQPPPSELPELQLQKSAEICHAVEQYMIIQFCQELVESQNIFHAFLIKNRRQNIQYLEERINCTMEYSMNLFYLLFQYIRTQNLVELILKRVNIPFGNSPIKNLKFLRNNLPSNQQQDIGQFEDDDDDGVVQPVLDSDMLVRFECQASEIPQEGQYFYNHAVYSCVNQILDTMRPFGQIGLPPLQREQNIRIRCVNIEKLYRTIAEKLEEMLCIRIGRTEFTEYEPQPIKIAERAYKIMDRFLIVEEEQKWKKVQDGICQEKYILSEAIWQCIISQEILVVSNEFL